MRLGGQALDVAIARRFGIDVTQAKAAKENEGCVDESLGDNSDSRRAFSETLIEALKPLVTQLSTTLKSLPVEDQPTKIYLTGGTSRLPGLCRHLEGRLGVSVELLDVGNALQTLHKQQNIGPEYAVCAGLVLAMLRRGRNLPMNLRSGPLAYSGDLQLYRGEIKRLAIGLAAVLVFAIAASIVRYSMINAEEKRIDQAFCSVTQKIVGREICDPTRAIATLRQAPGSDTGVIIPSYSAAQVFEMMSKAIDANVDVEFSELDFRIESGETDRVTGKGEAASFDTTEIIQTQLKQDKCVQEAEISKQRKARNSTRVEFNFAMKIQCPAGQSPGSQLKFASASPSSPKVKNSPTIAEDGDGSSPGIPEETNNLIQPPGDVMPPPMPMEMNPTGPRSSRVEGLRDRVFPRTSRAAGRVSRGRRDRQSNDDAGQNKRGE
ncbi:MAG: pilus assembly protein PilM [Myxococcota bacterium]